MKKNDKEELKDDYEGKLMDHDYDGIKELDNDLPTWWLAILIFTIILSAVYILQYHVFKGGNLMEQAYQRELNQAKVQQQARLADFDSLSEEEQATQLQAQGKAVYAANCAVCHGPEGQGMVGPNLTDEYFIHGGSLADITKIIKVGVVDKGMPKWEGTISPRQVDAVSLYVQSLIGKNLPGKPAEGKKGVTE